MTKQLSIRLEKELDEKIRFLAKRTKLKTSDIVRFALEKYVSDEMVPDSKKPYDKVKHLLGSFSSSADDLGTNHRQHLIKKFKNK